MFEYILKNIKDIKSDWSWYFENYESIINEAIKLYPTNKQSAEKYAKHKLGFKGKPNLSDYWTTRGWTEIEAIEKISEFQKNAAISARLKRGKLKENGFVQYSLEWFRQIHGDEKGLLFFNKNQELRKKPIKRNSWEWYVQKYGEDAEQMFKSNKDKKLVSEENLIFKYGEKLGKEKWHNYVNARKTCNTLDGYILKHGEELGTQKWEQKAKRISKGNSLEGYILKHGEELGTQKWNDHCLRVSKDKSYDGFVLRHGEELGKQKWNTFKDKSKQDLNNFIKRYGDEGYEKYADFISKSLAKGWKVSGFSKIAANFFESMIDDLNLDRSLCRFGSNEKTINLKKVEYETFGQTIIKPDFYYNDKIIIEFFGDYWHASETLFPDENQLIENLKATPKEIRERDSKRISILKNRGFEVIVIWEHESKNYNFDYLRSILN